MAELIPAPFQDLVTRLFKEPQFQDTLFELPRKKWYAPASAAPDTIVRFHARQAGNALGPAAGPHTQMAHNLLLSYVSGCRILELKTVQVDDRLRIPRPCIDMTNIGYNVEWSQELLVDDSLREYVAGAMLIEMYRRACDFTEGRFRGSDQDVLYDISVGYDLAGIRSDKVCRFLAGMRQAGPTIDALRRQIPQSLRAACDLDYSQRLSDSVTLSTFHGCPADEIESICEFLIAEHDFDVVVKMNPPMLGKERLEHLLYDLLGYTELTVNPEAYTSGLTFDEAVQLCDRLTAFARVRSRQLGFKFSNTLEVMNHREFFTPDNRIMYLSGQPLHVITLTLTDEFRRAVGPDVPISFSAGIDKFNFPTAVACGFVPVTVSTDLLRVGGYGRVQAYIAQLQQAMADVGAVDVDEFVLRAFGQQERAQQRAAAGTPEPQHDSIVRWAGLLNTSLAAEQARQEPRYQAAHNRKVPKRIESELETFDCITCDKCLPVCPNAANFTYPTPRVSFKYHDVIVSPDGTISTGDPKQFAIDQDMQIACYADFCNECGNCDTFCPEYGGPYIKKPTFFGSATSWEQAAPRDGFIVQRTTDGPVIRGRYQGREYLLTHSDGTGLNYFQDGTVKAVFSADAHQLVDVKPNSRLIKKHRIDVGVYHTLLHLCSGVLDPSRINQVNAKELEH